MANKKITGTAIVKGVNAKSGGVDISLTRIKEVKSLDPLIELSKPKAKDKQRVSFTISIPDPDQKTFPEVKE